MSLSAKLENNSAAAIADLQDEAARTAELAAAYDAAGYAGRLPWICKAKSKPDYEGATGSLHFRNVAPDEFAELLAAFPPIPRTEFKSRGCRSFRVGELPDDATEASECDGVDISVNGGGRDHGGSVRACWIADVGAVRVRFNIELRHVHFLHPRASRRAVMHGGHTFIRYEGPTVCNWPDSGTALHASGCHVRTYGAVSDQYVGDVHVRGNVIELARLWREECDARNAETRAAYERARDATGEQRITPEELAALVASSAGHYARQTMRAGSPRQHAALSSPQYAATLELARAHWLAWCADNGVTLPEHSQYFSDHTVAQTFLARHDLLTDAEFMHNGKPYAYGSAWLGAQS